MSLDNSASILPSFIDTAVLESEATLQDAEFSAAKESFSQDAVIRQSTNLAGASSDIQSYQTKMKNVISWYDSQNTTLKTALKGVSSDAYDYVKAFNEKKDAVKELEKKVEQERILEGIRQEQVKSLENREEANFHTSWMGLNRPLKPESHTGLIVAAGAFAALALVLIVIMYRSQAAPDFGGLGSFGSFFRGGFRMMRKRYSV